MQTRELDAPRRLGYAQFDIRQTVAHCTTRTSPGWLVSLQLRPTPRDYVIAGHTSNNTRERVQRCGRCCSRVHHAQHEADLSPAWFSEAALVGIAAGTSTPADVIDRVERRIRTFGRAGVLDPLDTAECVR